MQEEGELLGRLSCCAWKNSICISCRNKWCKKAVRFPQCPMCRKTGVEFPIDLNSSDEEA
jgi:hypothetical protein